MIDPGVVLSVLIGGALSLLGTLLAHRLQYCAEQRSLRQQRVRKRAEQVRRYLAACLDFADLISIPTTMGRAFGPDEMREWIDLVQEHVDAWKDLPVSGSSRVLYVDDEKLLEGLKRIDHLRLLFYLNYRGLVKDGQMIQYDAERDELRQLAAELGSRLDRVLEQT